MLDDGEHSTTSSDLASFNGSIGSSQNSTIISDSSETTSEIPAISRRFSFSDVFLDDKMSENGANIRSRSLSNDSIPNINIKRARY